MKIKVVVLSLAMVALQLSVAEAQKIKSQTVATTSIHYPIVAVPESFTTYQVRVKNVGINPADFPKITNLESRIQLQGFKRVAQLADLNVSIIVGSFRIYPM